MNLLETAARWTWENSLAASILIAPALLASLVLRKPSFTPVRHLLGLLIIARLLLPFTLPSPTSVFNFIKPKQSLAAPVSPLTQANPLPSPSLPLALSPTPTKNLPLFPAFWLVGACILLARVVFQHAKVVRWTRRENLITSGPALDALNSALTVSRCNRRIALYSHPEITSPALFGLSRPAILLPTELAAAGDETRLRLVCLHEIAHLRRMDVLVNWLMILVQALHWFNPLVWLALRRLRADQEILCDTDV